VADLIRSCAMIVVALAATGCGGGDGDDTPPTFRSGSTTVPPSGPVVVVASESLRAEGAVIGVRDRFQILGGGTTTLRSDGVTLEWRPVTEMLCGAVLSVGVSAFDVAGNAGETSFGGPTVVCSQ
jgi:hypothetical protein